MRQDTAHFTVGGALVDELVGKALGMLEAMAQLEQLGVDEPTRAN